MSRVLIQINSNFFSIKTNTMGERRENPCPHNNVKNKEQAQKYSQIARENPGGAKTQSEIQREQRRRRQFNNPSKPTNPTTPAATVARPNRRSGLNNKDWIPRKLFSHQTCRPSTAAGFLISRHNANTTISKSNFGDIMDVFKGYIHFHDLWVLLQKHPL